MSVFSILYRNLRRCNPHDSPLGAIVTVLQLARVDRVELLLRPAPPTRFKSIRLSLFLLPGKLQNSNSRIPFLKFLDKNAYNKGLIPELKYVIRKVRGVRRALKSLVPWYPLDQYCHILRAWKGKLHTANVSTTTISIRTTPRRARNTLRDRWLKWWQLLVSWFEHDFDFDGVCVFTWIERISLNNIKYWIKIVKIKYP